MAGEEKDSGWTTPPGWRVVGRGPTMPSRDKLGPVPDPELGTGMERKGWIVGAEGKRRPFHLWIAKPWLYRVREEGDGRNYAFELFCLPDLNYRIGGFQVGPDEALHTACVSAYIFHAAEAAILFDEAGARMDWPTPTPSEPIEESFLWENAEPSGDGLREDEARNRNFLKVMARARREVDGETLLCPLRISHQRLHDRPGEVAVKVDCEPLVPRGITYRRASEEEALADCYAYLLLRAKRLKVELETLEGEPLDLTPPWETLEGYPDLSNDTGREALFARLRGMLDPLELSRANFERAFGPQEGEEIEQEEED